MREQMKSLETRNEGMVMQIGTLKEELSTVKSDLLHSVGVSNVTSCANECEGIESSEKKKETQMEPNSKSNLIKLDKTQCYSCKACGTHIGLESEILNRCYQVGQGPFTEEKRGYLFNNAVNLNFAVAKLESFTTGSYNISTTSCAKCGVSLGWKYISASDDKNASKLGKYCLARCSLTSPQERNDQ